jgi:hypothetical protein
MPVVRTPWQDSPNVAVHTNMMAMKAHPAYAEAKGGDTKAARLVVKSFFKPEALASVASVDFVVPVMQLDVRERWNALPLELARSAARSLKARIPPLIVQDNVVHHTGADSLQRVIDQPSFTGTVLPGKYLIVDDVVTLGSTLANLRGWIELNGGKVALASTLSAAIFSTKLTPDWSSITSIRSRFPHDLTSFTQDLGFPVDWLTNREARYVGGLKNLNSLRNPGAAAHRAIGLGLG